MAAAKRRATSPWCLPAVCLAAGLAGLSVTITGPILVDIAEGYGITVALAGQLMTVASLAGMGGTLGLSPLLDRVGRREAITITLAGMTAASLGCAIAGGGREFRPPSPGFVILCVFYGLVGLGGYTLVALALAAIGDLYQGRELGWAMGWLVAGNMGITVVSLPIISALADRVAWPLAFVFYAALASAAAVVVHRSLPAGLCTAGAAHASYAAGFRRVFSNKAVLALLVTVAVYHASVYGFGTYIGAVAIERLGATTAQAGPILSVRLLGTVLAGLLAGRFLRATDWRLTATAALVCAVLSVAVYGARGSIATFVIMAALHGATIGVMDVGLNSLVVSVDAGGRGSVTALRSVMDSLGGVVGPALGGAIIAGSGYPGAGRLFALLALAAAAFIALSARLRGAPVRERSVEA